MRKFVCLLLIGLALASCSKKEEPQESTMMRSYRLIDEGRSDEAIDLLEQAEDENPKDIAIKVTLASAYARKANVRVQTLAPVVFAVQKYDALQDANAKGTSSSSAAKGVGLVLSAIERVSSIWAIYAAIPNMEKDQLPYLKHAVQILDAVAGELTPKDHVYRGILKAVILKSVIENELMTSHDLTDETFDACKPNFVALQSALNDIAKVLNDILDDMVIANPHQKAAMEKVRTEMVNGFAKAGEAITSISGGDGSLEAVVRERAVAAGFGRAFQCE